MSLSQDYSWAPFFSLVEKGIVNDYLLSVQKNMYIYKVTKDDGLLFVDEDLEKFFLTKKDENYLTTWRKLFGYLPQIKKVVKMFEYDVHIVFSTGFADYFSEILITGRKLQIVGFIESLMNFCNLILFKSIPVVSKILKLFRDILTFIPETLLHFLRNKLKNMTEHTYKKDSEEVREDEKIESSSSYFGLSESFISAFSQTLSQKLFDKLRSKNVLEKKDIEKLNVFNKISSVQIDSILLEGSDYFTSKTTEEVVEHTQISTSVKNSALFVIEFSLEIVYDIFNSKRSIGGNVMGNVITNLLIDEVKSEEQVRTNMLTLNLPLDVHDKIIEKRRKVVDVFNEESENNKGGFYFNDKGEMVALRQSNLEKSSLGSESNEWKIMMRLMAAYDHVFFASKLLTDKYAKESTKNMDIYFCITKGGNKIKLNKSGEKVDTIKIRENFSSCGIELDNKEKESDKTVPLRWFFRLDIDTIARSKILVDAEGIFKYKREKLSLMTKIMIVFEQQLVHFIMYLYDHLDCQGTSTYNGPYSYLYNKLYEQYFGKPITEKLSFVDLRWKNNTILNYIAETKKKNYATPVLQRNVLELPQPKSKMEQLNCVLVAMNLATSFIREGIEDMDTNETQKNEVLLNFSFDMDRFVEKEFIFKKLDASFIPRIFETKYFYYNKRILLKSEKVISSGFSDFKNEIYSYITAVKNDFIEINKMMCGFDIFNRDNRKEYNNVLKIQTLLDLGYTFDSSVNRFHKNNFVTLYNKNYFAGSSEEKMTNMTKRMLNVLYVDKTGDNDYFSLKKNKKEDFDVNALDITEDGRNFSSLSFYDKKLSKKMLQEKNVTKQKLIDIIEDVNKDLREKISGKPEKEGEEVSYWKKRSKIKDVTKSKRYYDMDLKNYILPSEIYSIFCFMFPKINIVVPYINHDNNSIIFLKSPFIKFQNFNPQLTSKTLYDYNKSYKRYSVYEEGINNSTQQHLVFAATRDGDYQLPNRIYTQNSDYYKYTKNDYFSKFREKIFQEQYECVCVIKTSTYILKKNTFGDIRDSICYFKQFNKETNKKEWYIYLNNYKYEKVNIKEAEKIRDEKIQHIENFLKTTTKIEEKKNAESYLDKLKSVSESEMIFNTLISTCEDEFFPSMYIYTSTNMNFNLKEQVLMENYVYNNSLTSYINELSEQLFYSTDLFKHVVKNVYQSIIFDFLVQLEYSYNILNITEETLIKNLNSYMQVNSDPVAFIYIDNNPINNNDVKNLHTQHIFTNVTIEKSSTGKVLITTKRNFQIKGESQNITKTDYTVTFFTADDKTTHKHIQILSINRNPTQGHDIELDITYDYIQKLKVTKIGVYKLIGISQTNIINSINGNHRVGLRSKILSLARLIENVIAFSQNEFSNYFDKSVNSTFNESLKAKHNNFFFNAKTKKINSYILSLGNLDAQKDSFVMADIKLDPQHINKDDIDKKIEIFKRRFAEPNKYQPILEQHELFKFYEFLAEFTKTYDGYLKDMKQMVKHAEKSKLESDSTSNNNFIIEVIKRIADPNDFFHKKLVQMGFNMDLLYFKYNLDGGDKNDMYKKKFVNILNSTYVRYKDGVRIFSDYNILTDNLSGNKKQYVSKNIVSIMTSLTFWFKPQDDWLYKNKYSYLTLSKFFKNEVTSHTLFIPPEIRSESLLLNFVKKSKPFEFINSELFSTFSTDIKTKYANLLSKKMTDFLTTVVKDKSTESDSIFSTFSYSVIKKSNRITDAVFYYKHILETLFDEYIIKNNYFFNKKIRQYLSNLDIQVSYENILTPLYTQIDFYFEQSNEVGLSMDSSNTKNLVSYLVDIRFNDTSDTIIKRISLTLFYGFLYNITRMTRIFNFYKELLAELYERNYTDTIDLYQEYRSIVNQQTKNRENVRSVFFKSTNIENGINLFKDEVKKVVFSIDIHHITNEVYFSIKYDNDVLNVNKVEIFSKIYSTINNIFLVNVSYKQQNETSTSFESSSAYSVGISDSNSVKSKEQSENHVIYFIDLDFFCSFSNVFLVEAVLNITNSVKRMFDVIEENKIVYFAKMIEKNNESIYYKNTSTFIKETIKFIKKVEKIDTDKKILPLPSSKNPVNFVEIFENNIESTYDNLNSKTKELGILSSKINSTTNKENKAKIKKDFDDEVNKLKIKYGQGIDDDIDDYKKYYTDLARNNFLKTKENNEEFIINLKEKAKLFTENIFEKDDFSENNVVEAQEE